MSYISCKDDLLLFRITPKKIDKKLENFEVILAFYSYTNTYAAKYILADKSSNRMKRCHLEEINNLADRKVWPRAFGNRNGYNMRKYKSIKQIKIVKTRSQLFKSFLVCLWFYCVSSCIHFYDCTSHLPLGKNCKWKYLVDVYWRERSLQNLKNVKTVI